MGTRKVLDGILGRILELLRIGLGVPFRLPDDRPGTVRTVEAQQAVASPTGSRLRTRQLGRQSREQRSCAPAVGYPNPGLHLTQRLLVCSRPSVAEPCSQIGQLDVDGQLVRIQLRVED